MDITYDELERYLSRIFTGVELVYVNNGSIDVCVEFRPITNAMLIRANLVFDKSYKEAIAEGMLSSEDLEKLIRKRNIFTEQDEQKIEKLNTQLEAQQILLAKTTVVKAKQDRIKSIIANIRSEMDEIYSKKSSKMHMSAEAKAEEGKSLYLCWASSHNADTGKSLWATYPDILKETNINFKDNVFLRFLKYNRGIDTRIIRYIARSNLWRIRYVTSLKTSESLFGIPTSEYTNDMLNLAYWSNYYQSIYEMLPEDRPSELIIEDDEALDAYMQSYYDEKNKEDAARRSKYKTSGRLSAFDKEEVIVTQSNELYEDIKYDKPREAQKIKNKAMIKKTARPRR
jgi:hypothetical protein